MAHASPDNSPGVPDIARRDVSPRSIALEATIAASLEVLRQHPGSHTPAEALLFVGNWNDALPRLLIHDQVLEPVDKIVWAVIRTQADPQRGTAFPSYTTIGRLANVGSEATVSRAVAILRVTRWLTLCGRARDGRGRFRGSVYALHDEPLALADTLYLDQDYMSFAYQATTHHHARVARVAVSIVRSLELDLADGSDPAAVQDAASQRLAAQQDLARAVLDGNAGIIDDSARTLSRSVYGVRARLRQQLRQQLVAAPAEGDQLQNLKAVDEEAHPQNLTPGDQRQILKAVHPQNLRPQNLGVAVVVGSSSTNTTTTATARNIQHDGTRSTAERKDSTVPVPDSPIDSLGVLRWPALLSVNYRHLAAVQLRRVPINLRQAVLDILERRLQAIEHGGERLHYGPLAYLKTLCTKAVPGQLVLPQTAAGAAIPPPSERESALARLQARLRVARADHAHWQRLASLYTDPERQDPILALIAQAADEVVRLEAELNATTADGAR